MIASASNRKAELGALRPDRRPNIHYQGITSRINTIQGSRLELTVRPDKNCMGEGRAANTQEAAAYFFAQAHWC
jgi:hypothetical protein